MKTLTELQDDPLKLLKQAAKSGEPIFLTSEGKAIGVLTDLATYERMRDNVRLARLLGEAEADVRAGRVRPAEEFFAELEREGKLSGKDHSRRRA